MSNPSVSIIIPLCNATGYLGECLNSLLNQTFTDFEVVVVDDCSAVDSRIALVEKYTSKFDGRLLSASTSKISDGGSAFNLGLKLATGDYVFCLDPNDFLANNALELLLGSAQANEAEVVYTSPCNEVRRANDIQLLQGGAPDTALNVDTPDKNLERLFADKTANFNAPRSKFLKRDFLAANEIFFPEGITDGDFLWSMEVCCRAKRFFCQPKPFYFWRSYKNATPRSEVEPAEQIASTVSNFIKLLEALQALALKTPFLRENPSYLYAAADMVFERQFGLLSRALRPLRSKEVYDLLQRELSEASTPLRLTVSIMFSELVRWDKNSKMLRSKLAKLKDKG